jgi:hypothetical protein
MSSPAFTFRARRADGTVRETVGLTAEHGAKLGKGRAIAYDGVDPEHNELERVRVLEGEHGVMHLRYRVRRGA